MAGVVVRAPFGLPRSHRQQRPGAIEGLDLALLLDAQHQGPIRGTEIQVGEQPSEPPGQKPTAAPADRLLGRSSRPTMALLLPAAQPRTSCAPCPAREHLAFTRAEDQWRILSVECASAFSFPHRERTRRATCFTFSRDRILVSRVGDPLASRATLARISSAGLRRHTWLHQLEPSLYQTDPRGTLRLSPLFTGATSSRAKAEGAHLPHPHAFMRRRWVLPRGQSSELKGGGGRSCTVADSKESSSR